MGQGASNWWSNAWPKIRDKVNQIICLTKFWQTDDTCGLDFTGVSYVIVPLKFLIFAMTVICTLGILFVLSQVATGGAEIFGDFWAVISWVMGIIVNAGELFFFLWLWGVEKSYAVWEAIQEATDCNKFLTFLTPTLLLVWSLLYTAVSVYKLSQDLAPTQLWKVYHAINYPIREWVYKDILIKYFGNIVGNMLFLVFIPIEIALLFISMPIAGVWWLWDKFQDKSALKSKYYLNEEVNRS